MKKISLLTFLFACIAILVFAGCNGGKEFKGGGELYLDVKTVAFTADSSVIELDDNTSVKDYLDALKRCGKLVFSGEDGLYGFYIDTIFSTKAEGNSYWAIYTDLSEFDGVNYSNPSYGTFELNGKSLYSASYGVSYLPCVEGYTYAFVLEQY